MTGTKGEDGRKRAGQGNDGDEDGGKREGCRWSLRSFGVQLQGLSDSGGLGLHATKSPQIVQLLLQSTVSVIPP